MTYDNLDQVIDYIAARDKPLAVLLIDRVVLGAGEPLVGVVVAQPAMAARRGPDAGRFPHRLGRAVLAARLRR